LKRLPSDSTDCIAFSLVDKYACRTSNPHLHQLGADDVCLADFAALFSPVQHQQADDENDDADVPEGLELESDFAAAEQVSLSTISDFERRRYHRRAQERVIRYVHYKLHDDPEAYYREQFLLYYPWSAKTSEPLCLSADEDSYLLDGHETFESKYLSVQDDIAKNRKRYEFNDRLDWDETQRTAKELEEANDLLLRGAIDIDAPDAARSADVAEQYDFGEDMGMRATTSSASSVKLPLSPMADDEFKVESRRLIWDQRRYLYHIMHLYRYGAKLPFYEFLTGGAGTGKTVVLRVIAEAINRMHNSRVRTNPASMKVLLVAFTGSAAFNVGGTTIHHAFRVPFGCRLLPYKRLASEERCKMRDACKDLLCLIIDEVSMTGGTLLCYIHRQLQDVFENSLLFGGLPVLASGDLYQLKPVSENYCFQGIGVEDSNQELTTVFNLWADLLRMYKPTTILRQRDALPFAEALNRLRTGDHTTSDLQLFKRFEIDPLYPPQDYSIFLRHIFATHRQRDEHNEKGAVEAAKTRVESRDAVLAAFVSQRDRDYFLQKAKSLDESKTATLHSTLYLKPGIILEVTTNVDVLDGLYNGAWGVLQFVDPPSKPSPDILWIAFADPRIGRQCREVHRRLHESGGEVHESWTPVFRVLRSFQVTARYESVVLKWQSPVHPATAGTFHHNEGLTLKRGAVNFRGPKRFAKMAGRHYVDYSRFSNPEHNLFVLDPAKEEIHVDPRVHVEMARLRFRSTSLCIFNGLQREYRIPNLIQIVIHNTRSLKAHVDNIRSDCNLLAADILVFTEARLKQSSSPERLQIQGFRNDFANCFSNVHPSNVAV
jgi:hypothetical protein